MKNNLIELPITIYTEIEFENDYQKARQQVEQTSYHLSALLWLMKKTCEGYDLLDMQTESKLFDFQTLRCNIQLVCKLAEALSEQLTGYITAFPNYPIQTTEPNLDALAVQLSAVLNNPQIPEDLYNGIHRSLNDIFNDIDSEEVLKFENSSEYIARILRGKKQSESD